MKMMTEMDERHIRSWGLTLLSIGALLVYFIRN